MTDDATKREDQAAPQPPAGGEDEAAQLWADMDAAESAGAAAEPAAEQDDTPPPPAEDAEGEPDAEWEAAASEGEEPGEAKAPDATDGKPSAAEAKSDAASAPQEDIWSGATEAQRKAWQQSQEALRTLEQYRRSNEGRVAAFQRQIDELRRQVAAPGGQDPQAAAKAASKPDGQSANPSASQEQKDAAQDAFASDGWKTLEEDYPEIAGTIRAVIDPLLKEVAPMRQHLSAVQADKQAQQQAAAQEREMQALAELVPDWSETLGQHKQDFTNWINGQPRYVQDAFRANFDAITDANAAADIIGRFKQHLATAQQTQPPAEAGTTETASMPDRRKRQLQSSASIRSKAPPAAIGIPDDPQGAWDAFERMGL